jgi:hypothetical protein
MTAMNDNVKGNTIALVFIGTGLTFLIGGIVGSIYHTGLWGILSLVGFAMLMAG